MFYKSDKVYTYLKELYLKLGTKEEDVEFMILHDRSFILEQKKDQLRSFIFGCIEQDELDNPVELFSYFHKIVLIAIDGACDLETLDNLFNYFCTFRENLVSFGTINFSAVNSDKSKKFN